MDDFVVLTKTKTEFVAVQKHEFRRGSTWRNGDTDIVTPRKEYLNSEYYLNLYIRSGKLTWGSNKTSNEIETISAVEYFRRYHIRPKSKVGVPYHIKASKISFNRILKEVLEDNLTTIGALVLPVEGSYGTLLLFESFLSKIPSHLSDSYKIANERVWTGWGYWGEGIFTCLTKDEKLVKEHLEGAKGLRINKSEVKKAMAILKVLKEEIERDKNPRTDVKVIPIV